MLVFRGVIVFSDQDQTVPTPPEWMKFVDQKPLEGWFLSTSFRVIFSTSMIMGGRVLDNHQPGSLLSKHLIQGHGDIAFT